MANLGKEFLGMINQYKVVVDKLRNEVRAQGYHELEVVQNIMTNMVPKDSGLTSLRIYKLHLQNGLMLPEKEYKVYYAEHIQPIGIIIGIGITDEFFINNKTINKLDGPTKSICNNDTLENVKCRDILPSQHSGYRGYDR